MHSLPSLSVSTIAAILLLSGLSGASAPPRLRGAAELHKLDKHDAIDRTTTKKKVIVIGAGVSGLTTALALQMQGHDVRILEYQDRVGGRLWSADLEYGDAVTELGGGHFRSNMPLTLAYVDYYGLNKKLVVMNDGLPRYQTGDLVGQASDLTSLAKWKLHQNETNVTPTSLMNYYLSKSGLDTIRVLDADFPNAREQRKFDTKTLKDMFRDAGASPGLVQLLEAHGGESIRSCMSHESVAGTHLNSKKHSGGIMNAPSLSMLSDLAYHFGDQNLYRIGGGNVQLPERMAAHFGTENILLGEEGQVVHIDQTSPETVRIHTKDGRVHEADEVVSTASFLLFKDNDITISPSWSEGKQRMIDEFEWGNTIKVVCQTMSPTWLSAGVHGWPMAGMSRADVDDRTPEDRIWERVIDITGASRYGNVFFYLNGDNADKVAELYPEDSSGDYIGKRADFVISSFQEPMPGLIDECIYRTSIYWNEVDWMKGSFGNTPINGAWMIEEWTQPEDRVWLSGDFTTVKTGWVEGAIESGLRVAKAIDPNSDRVFDPP